MNQVGKRSACLLLVAFFLAGTELSFASDALQRIAVVDIQKALQMVGDGKKAKSQLEKEANAKNAEFQKEEAALKKMNEDFQKQSLVMNDEARGKKQAELQSRFMKLQQSFQQTQEEMANKERTLLQPIISKMRTVIAELAKKKNYSVVLAKNEAIVPYSEDKDDLTNEVITLFDKGSKS